MKTTSLLIGFLGLAVALAPPGIADSKIVPVSPDQDDITVETRGPIHEAYAAPVKTSPRPGLIVDKEPPEPIKEVPPDQKPEGDNVQWIPGYWAWDSDHSDYVWVSGFWRATPPNRKWVPGHWSEADGGWQWVGGFWAPAAEEAIPYLEKAPPDSLDDGPSVPAPDDKSVYVPGNWVPQTGGYAWQAGYWADARPGYVWTPPQYYWTPTGYCYVDGYWDYPLEDRGLLFAPVYFSRPLWTNPDWYYQPSYCLPFGGLLSWLFCRPSWGCYYFGDYFGPGYFNAGFYPWFAYGRRWHDPLFGYYNWRNRDNPGWFRGLAGDYRARAAGSLPRPPRTLAQQNALVQRSNNGNLSRRTLNSLQTVRRLDQIGGNGVRLAKLTPTQANAARQTATAFRQASLDRQRLERPASAGAGRPAALSLTRVPTTTAIARTPNSQFSSRRPAPSAQPQASGFGGSRNPAAATRSRGAPEFANSTGQAGSGFRDSWHASPSVSRSGGPPDRGIHAVPSNSARHSSQPAPTRRDLPPVSSSVHHAAPSYHAPARHESPHQAQHAPRASGHFTSGPTHHAALSHQGGSGHSGSGHSSRGPQSTGTAHSGGGSHSGGGHSGSGGNAGGHSGGGGHSSGGHSGGGHAKDKH
jgi:hypothetical protein